MKDADGVQFLQWTLPRLGFRWPGFRKVRRQVLRRIAKRLSELGLEDLAAYRLYLESHPQEWRRLDSCCRVTISRFYRDRGVWNLLGDEVLPYLAAAASRRGDSVLRAWSAGCASGEEPYTLGIVWKLAVGSPMPLQVTATDADAHMLERARRARYPSGTLKELPADWRRQAFVPSGEDGELLLEPACSAEIEWRCEDLRRQMSEGPFDLILCRNLAFTYFDEALQRQILERLVARLVPGGVLVLGAHESLPEQLIGLEPWPGSHGLRSSVISWCPPGTEVSVPQRGTRG